MGNYCATQCNSSIYGSGFAGHSPLNVIKEPENLLRQCNIIRTKRLTPIESCSSYTRTNIFIF